MPTPFYHLSLARSILQHPDLPASIRRFLEQQACPFLLGNTAPDVQVISGQRRQETHFFTIPILPGLPLPWVRMFRDYPHLSDPARLAPDHAAFLCGYIAHLQADISWINQIYAPIFITGFWGSHPRRSYIHNVLRSYLDQQALAALDDHPGECLGSVEPSGYLPFTADSDLREWRNFISAQLLPGGETKTVEVFARRAGMDPQQFAELLRSPTRMDREVFSHISRSSLDRFRQDLVSLSVQRVVAYLSGHLTSA